MLSSEELRTFDLENGFLLLQQAIPLELCDRVNAEIDYALTAGRDQFGDADFVVLQGADTNKRMFLRDIKSKYRDLPFKLSNIYRYSPIVRSVALHPTVRKTLTWCLAGTPVTDPSLNASRISSSFTGDAFVEVFRTDNLGGRYDFTVAARAE